VKLNEAEGFEFLTLRALPTQMAEQANTAPTASVNPAATSPEIICQRSRSRWICSVVAALPGTGQELCGAFQHLLSSALSEVYVHVAV
jgi:hypothetical protein